MRSSVDTEAGGRTPADIVARIKDQDRAVREDAAIELMEAARPEHAVELCAMLADSDISVRNLVAEILVKMGMSASEALIKESTSDDNDVRKFVVDTMASIGDRRFVPVLIELLNDPNENVVCSAAEALGAIGAAEALEPLLDALNRHQYASCQIVEALGNIGSSKALPCLIDNSESTDLVLKYAAIEALSKINSREALEKLLSLLQVDNHELRNAVLTSILKKADSDIRSVLDDMTGGNFISYLLEAARSDDLEAKKAALGELAFWNGQKVVETLVQALNDDDEEVVRLADSALRMAGAADTAAIIIGLQKGPDRVQMALIQISSAIKSAELLDNILRLADSGNPDIRLTIAQTLAKYGEEKVIEALIKLADDKIGHVRAEALKSLGFLGAAGAVTEIARHLDDEYGDVCEAALGALILIGGDTTISLLKNDLGSTNLQRKLMAIRGLGWIGEDESVAALVDALSNEEPEVRRHAVIGLAKMKYSGLEKSLTYMVADENPEVRKAVIDAYLNLSGPAAGDKIRVLFDDDDLWVRFYAINAVISIGDTASLDKLLEIMPAQPPFAQIAIINFLARHDRWQVTAELQKLIQSENEDIREAARQALEVNDAG